MESDPTVEHEYYSHPFIEQMRHPVGQAESPDFPVSGEATLTGRVAGSFVSLWIAVDLEARLARLAWRSRYFPRIVPGMSAMAAWIEEGDGQGPGRPLQEALGLRPDFLADRLGGLPVRIIHETIIGPRLLENAITDYFLSIGLTGRKDQPPPGSPATRPPPCNCLETTERILLDALHADANGPGDVPPSRLPDCPTCQAFAPAVFSWCRLRRRRREMER